jgi:ABC-type branched-subunit amino acid transport system substrate-binding protein
MADTSTDALSELPDIFAGRRERRRRRKRAAAAVAAAALVAAAVWGGTVLARGPAPCGGSGSGLSLIGGECVGVTDGSAGDYFAPELAPVVRDIARENAWAVKSGQLVVTVAVLEPITADAASALTVAQVRNDLEGAYTAQYRANHTAVVGDRVPLIRLVLANEGGHEDQWRQVVRQLEGMTGGSRPLVAVTGLGVSTAQTFSGAEDLAARKIPTVASIDTADQLTDTDIPGFVRVAAGNGQYAASLRRYLAGTPGPHSAILVYDSNSDDPAGADLFTASLRDDLQAAFSAQLRFAPQGFTGVSGATGARPDLFAGVTANICAVRPGVVLFAGRGVDLGGFLQSLEARVCSQTPITVATAGSNLGGVGAQPAVLLGARITLVYAAQADPAGWLADEPGTPPHFADFAAAFAQRGFPPSDLVDGGAIASHDAVLVAVQAIRLAAQAGRTPSASDVFGQVLNLNNEFTVPGAGGDLSFSLHGPDGSLSGDPIGKPVPVIVVPPPAGRSAPQSPYITVQ